MASTALLVGNIAIASHASLQILWGQINALQITAHLPLNNITFPGNVELVFEELIKIVTFDIADLDAV